MHRSPRLEQDSFSLDSTKNVNVLKHFYLLVLDSD